MIPNCATDAAPERGNDSPATLADNALSAVIAIGGAALVFGAAALWILPGASNPPELVLMKLGLSAFLLGAGFAGLGAARSRDI